MGALGFLRKKAKTARHQPSTSAGLRPPVESDRRLIPLCPYGSGEPRPDNFSWSRLPLGAEKGSSMNRTVASILVVIASSVASPTIYFFSSPESLAAKGRFDLSRSGRPGTRYPTGLSLTVTGSFGPAALMGTVSGSGAIERQDQGNTWQGDFQDGEALVWTAHNSNQLTFRMSKPVGGLGTYVGAAAQGAYKAKIEALGAGDQVMATFTADGFNNGMGLGEAPYLGVGSDSVDLTGIRLSLVDGGDFAISSVDVRPNPVPEPHLWAASALVGAWWLRRRVWA